MCGTSQIRPNPLFIHPLTNLSEDCVGAMACYVRMLLKEVLVWWNSWNILQYVPDVLVLLATSLRRAGCLCIYKDQMFPVSAYCTSNTAFGKQAFREWTFPCIGHKCIPCFEAPSFARWAPSGTSHRCKRCHEPWPPYFLCSKRSILVNSTRKSFSTPGNTWDFVRFVMIIECRQSLQYICTDILAFTWQLDSMPHHVHISTKVIHLAYGFDSCWPHSNCFWTNVLAVHLP